MVWLLPWDEDTHVRHMPWATWSLVALNVAAFVAIYARLYGVMRRYDKLSEGSTLLGYWPTHLEYARPRRPRR